MAPGAAAPSAAPGLSPAVMRHDAGLSWVLLPTAWCVWLLVWLIPVMLVAPHVAVPRMWMTLGTAPAAVLIAAVFFLVAIWPFWPALAREAAPADGAEAMPTRAGGSPPRAEGSPRRRAGGRWIGLSILEVIILLALAAPFALVAWSVGGRTIEPWPLAAALAGPVVLALGLRIAVGGLPPAAARWLMFVATLISAGPPLVAYAFTETMGVWNLRLLEVSPIVASLRLTLEGWPAGAWPIFSQLVLWPAAGVTLAIIGLAAGRSSAGPATDSHR